MMINLQQHFDVANIEAANKMVGFDLQHEWPFYYFEHPTGDGRSQTGVRNADGAVLVERRLTLLESLTYLGSRSNYFLQLFPAATNASDESLGFDPVHDLPNASLIGVESFE